MWAHQHPAASQRVSTGSNAMRGYPTMLTIASTSRMAVALTSAKGVCQRKCASVSPAMKHRAASNRGILRNRRGSTAGFASIQNRAVPRTLIGKLWLVCHEGGCLSSSKHHNGFHVEGLGKEI